MRVKRDRHRVGFAGLGLLGGLVALGLATCYSPHVVPHGLACAPVSATAPAGVSGLCPDGFVCVDGLCDAIAGAGGGGNGGVSGQGGAAGGGGTCANPIAPLCSARNESPCDPVCQTGCPCGQRCTASGATPECRLPSSLTPVPKEGDLCDPNASPDACAPGYVCALEPCGTNLGRCYRLCRDATTCANMVCGSRAGVAHKVCDLPLMVAPNLCDPLANTGCPVASLTCLVADPRNTACDCLTKSGLEGDTCDNYRYCGTGLACFQFQTDPTAKCLRLCDPTTGVPCPSVCTAFVPGGPFWFCPLPP